MLRATGAQTGVSIQSLGTTIITFGQQGQLDPYGTTLTFITCYRDSGTGAGVSTSAVPGAQLVVGAAGSAMSSTVAAGASCTP